MNGTEEEADLGDVADALLREAALTPAFPTGGTKNCNGPIDGAEGDDCPGALWTGSYLNRDNEHLRPARLVRCAVLPSEGYGERPYAWSRRRWNIVSDYTAQEIFRAWGRAMEARSQRTEWLLEGLQRQWGRDSAAGFDPELVAWALDEARERMRLGAGTSIGITDKLARAVLMLEADAQEENAARKREIRELQEQRDAAWSEAEQLRGAGGRRG